MNTVCRRLRIRRKLATTIVSTRDSILLRVVAVCAVTLIGIGAHAKEPVSSWNQFRGPNGDGRSTATSLPTRFDESKNVRWKTEIPDSGWSSPVVWQDEIWLTSGSDEKSELRAVCVDATSGKIVHDVKVFEMLERKVDPSYRFDSPHLNSPATPTAVVEEERVFVSFGSQGIACLDRKTGKKVWERRDLKIYQPVRQGSSLIIDDKSLFVAFDGNFEQYFVALDKLTGQTHWKQDRNVATDWQGTLNARGLDSEKAGGKPGDNKKSFATATLIEVNGQRQLIAPAGEAVMAYDPESGEELWRVLYPGGFNVSARPIFANGLVYLFTSGLERILMAIKPDGSGDVTDTHVAWSTRKGTPGIPSPVIVDDLLFMVSDKGGIVRCLDAVSGEQIWTKRVGGDHWASPLYADGMLFFSSKQGVVTTLQASGTKPESMIQNEMNGRFIASPAVVGDSGLILRSTTHLYCIEEGYRRSPEAVATETPREAAEESMEKSVAEDGAAKVNWDLAYAKVLESRPEIRKKVENGGATKEQIIKWMKMQLASQKKTEKSGGKENVKGKKSAKNANGSVGFYAVVIGRLRTKDIELGEFTMTVDHASSMYDNRWVKDEIVGKTVTVTGVSGQFLDGLLQIKRGETLKVRTGSYLAPKTTLTFGPKFHVLERTSPFQPEYFGVPPDGFRGYRGELTGTIVEVGGFEMLLRVTDFQPAKESKASTPESIRGKRVRVVGFYNQHREGFGELHEGDRVVLSVSHPNLRHDELTVTETMTKVAE